MASELDHGLLMSANDKEEEEESFRHIPHDLLTNYIIPKLPIKTLIRFKSVSKRWYSIISSSKFTNTHFKLPPFSPHTQCLIVKSGQSFNLFCYQDDNHEFAAYFGTKGLIQLNPNFDLHDLHLVGSSNGLLCLSSSLGFFIVWNPVTNQFRTICDPFDVQTCPSCWGFGYCVSDDEYKIVRIIENPKMIVHVFSLSKNQWRVVDDKFYKYLFSSGTIMSDVVPASLSFRTRRGMFVNDSLYWIVENTRVSERKIITFNLNLEMFDVFPYLDLISPGLYDDDRHLCVMGGCLASYRVNLREDVYITMFKSHRERESVVLLRDFRIGACDDLVGFTKSGKFFVVDKYCRKLGMVDRSSSRFEYIPIARFETHDIHITNHVPTMISPFRDE